MAPPAIIDYVVVHEMCHLIYLNHSKYFWQKVGSILPDYKKRRKWLKDNGLRLDRIIILRHEFIPAVHDYVYFWPSMGW